MGVQGPDNRPQQDTTGVRKFDVKADRANGEVLTGEAKQFAENAQNMIIEAFTKLKTLVNPETEAEARENAKADLSMDEKLSQLNKIAEQMKEIDSVTDKTKILLDEIHLTILLQELERIISSGQDMSDRTDEIKKQIAEIESKLDVAKIKQETYDVQKKWLQQDVKEFPPQFLE